MITTHTLSIAGTCPVDGKLDVYSLTVTVEDAIVEVEKILEVVEKVTAEPAYQEQITERLAAEFGDGVMVETYGRHSGVETTCRAPK